MMRSQARAHADFPAVPLQVITLLRQGGRAPTLCPMWNQPYLETCCRSALHRLTLVASHGRPPGLKDGPCLERLTGMGLARPREDGRFEITDAGRARHAMEILRRETVA